MHGILGYIDHRFKLNVGKYCMHGASGKSSLLIVSNCPHCPINALFFKVYVVLAETSLRKYMLFDTAVCVWA